MKVWELINRIKGTDATERVILNWMVKNRICPLEVGAELEEGDQPRLDALAREHCGPRPTRDCHSGCYREFLEMDVPGEGATT